MKFNTGNEFTVIFVCSVCGRGMLEPIAINTQTGEERCGDHLPAEIQHLVDQFPKPNIDPNSPLLP